MPLPSRSVSSTSSIRNRVLPGARPHGSRNTTASSIPIVQQAESLILSDGPVGEEAAELLTDFVRHHADETLVADDEESMLEADADDGDDTDEWAGKPWWKRPSPYWLLFMMLLSAPATGMTIAPRIEIYTLLACSVHKPEVFEIAPIGANLPYIIPHKLDPLSNSNPTDSFLSSASWPNDTVRVQAGHGYDDTYKLCAKDPVVQAAVAQLSTALTTTLGVLSCLTTGWWGNFSDRWGRTRLMGIAVMGVLFTDIIIILVALFPRSIPGGYWFLIIGSVVDGLVGGVTTASAAMHAYIADTTSPSSRSRFLSLSLGILFIGIALGPTLGSLIIRLTQQALFVFYLAAGLHAFYAFICWFVLPESLSEKDMIEFRENSRKKELAESRERELEVANGAGLLTRTASSTKRCFKFLAPLGIFIPFRDSSSLTGRNWNLTLIALGYGFTISIMASYPFKFQYAAATFGWTSETLGYFMSIVGAVRAVFLAIVLPIIIKIFKPKPELVPIPPHEQTERAPLLPSNPSSSSISRSRSPNPRSLRELHSPSFDLGLARVSLLIDALSFVFMGHAPTGIAFTFFGVVGSMGTGFTPAIQSVAVELFMAKGEKESGKLFGALSVVQSLSSQIIGPAVFGYTYVQTVKTYPRTIFYLSVVAALISFILISFIRLPKHDVRSNEDDTENGSSLGREAPLG
ncbi:hypothetical protein HGRIS_012889 [Hohenbuehelia grisea]|uniref:MFS general substrate transporter n=1 Tax=Hohenbuehelia grisea TaxID=104357 RepID=A0ABR3ITT8_9AGAR